MIQKEKLLSAAITAAIVLCLLLMMLFVLLRGQRADSVRKAQTAPERETICTEAPVQMQAGSSLPSAPQKQTAKGAEATEEQLPEAPTEEAISGRQAAGEDSAVSPSDALEDASQNPQVSAPASEQAASETTASNNGAFDLPPDDF